VGYEVWGLWFEVRGMGCGGVKFRL